MEKLDLAVVNGTVVLGGGRYRVAVGVKDGKVVALAPEELLPPAKETIDARGNYILPGIVDSEAHPGCYVPFSYDMTTESKAAACAGVTTWGIQAPVTRMGTEPFKEVVSKADVVSFNESFPSAKKVIEDVSYADAYLTYMLETDQHAHEIPSTPRNMGSPRSSCTCRRGGCGEWPRTRTATGRAVAPVWASASTTAPCTW